MYKLAIIIPAYNAESTIINCLESLINQDLDHHCFQVIVVNDGSTDRTISFINDLKYSPSFNLNVLTQKNSGAATARNTGIAIASSSIVAFTDSDCIATETWASSIVNFFENNQQLIVGGPVSCDDTVIYPWKLSPAGQARITANLAVNHEVLDRVRFDPIFTQLGEDTDFIYRVEKSFNTNFYFNDSMKIVHPAYSLNSRSVIKRAAARGIEAHLLTLYGDSVLKSMNLLYRPIILKRISCMGLLALIILITLLLSAVFNLHFVSIMALLVFSIGHLYFIAKGYQFFTYPKLTYIPIKDRFITIFNLYLYNSTYLTVRIWTSIKQRKILV